MKTAKISALSGAQACSLALRQLRPAAVVSYRFRTQDNPVEFLARQAAIPHAEPLIRFASGPTSALSFSIGAARTGGRVILILDSGGLSPVSGLLGEASRLRLPLIINVISNTTSSATDLLIGGDCLQFHCTSVQEVYDANLVLSRLVEDGSVRLPVIIFQDESKISRFVENAAILPDSTTDKFITTIKYEHISPAPPLSAVPNQVEQKILEKFNSYSSLFAGISGRTLRMVEAEGPTESKTALVAVGPYAEIFGGVREYFKTRSTPLKTLLLKLYHPLPENQIKEFLVGISNVIIIEPLITSFGHSNLYNIIAGLLSGSGYNPNFVSLNLSRGNQEINTELLVKLLTNIE
ncbi:MAG: hypothetical protein AAB486_03235 [Patescibacteria group bacterium]